MEALSQAEIVFMSVIVMGELHAGFRGGNQFKKNKENLEQFLIKPTVEILPVTSETSEIFGQIKNTLKKAGTPIPLNDIWIASQATESGSVLITFDEHFKNIPGLRNWETL